MDKKALQNFALFAKDSLETQIKVSLKLIGIHSDKDIKKAYIQGDFTIIDGDSKTYPSDLKVKRDHILELIKTDGYDYTIEQFAYTWFNRLIALRFMEVHEYLPHGFKVFPKGNGSIEPEILGKLTLVEKELNLDIELCRQFKENAQIEELYRYVLFQQCNALSSILPMLFSKEYAYLELMLPSTLLKGTTVITELIKIDESNFWDDIEVIGWIYQFYISVKKDEVFASKKSITKETLPAVTQLFTPDWIVRYMTENSLGRLWLESYPDSTIKNEFKYYVDDIEQTDESNIQIETVRYKNVDPKDIKIIEPCSGSGHILVYAFDVLYLMYEEKGYAKNDIPKLILENNLFGLDVDKRASQLASFSLVMKARSIDSRYFQPARFTFPKVFEIKDSKMLISMNYKHKLLDLNSNDWKNDERLNEEELKVIDYVIETFIDGKVIGSLIKVNRKNYIPIINKIVHLQKVTIRGIFNGEFVEYGLKRIVQLLRLAEVMSRKYDVTITNPPYIGIDKLEIAVKNYARDNYPLSKNDMYTMFMETQLPKKNGFVSIINQHQWMFLSSYSEFRKSLISRYDFVNVLHLGPGTFEHISGEMVQSCAFIFRNTFMSSKTLFIDLTNSEGYLSKENDFLSKSYITHFKNITSFSKIPDNKFIYEFNDSIIECFNKQKITDFIIFKSGISPGKKDFIKRWFEVKVSDIKFDCNNSEDMQDYKWFPINTGGEYRKWYGNNLDVINLHEDGKLIKTQTVNYRLRDKKYYFKNGITWSRISSTNLAFRKIYDGSLFGDAGPIGFIETNLHYLLGLLQSKIPSYMIKKMNPSVTFQIADLKNIPVIIDDKVQLEVEILVQECIDISKTEWDSYETSWDFDKHPLIAKPNDTIKENYFNWEATQENWRKKINHNEERLDEIFGKLYNVNFDKNMFNNERLITLRFANKKDDVKSLISYFIGVICGRYGKGFYESQISSNGLYSESSSISVLYSKINMNDGLDNKLFNLIRKIYGNSNYNHNIEFVADSLGRKANETPEETINRYLLDGFYKDHLKTYSSNDGKCPIYWMFSSGRYNAFNCLMYIHKYDEDTLATINSQYLLPESTRLKYELNELNNQLVKADDKTRRILEKEKVVLENKYNEIIEYGQVLDHMANRYISIDLDDGVKVNYEKFQGIEIVTDSGTRIKKDLLVPIK